MAVIKCTECDTEYDNSLNGCPKCGLKNAHENPANNKSIFAVIGGGILILIVIILLINGSSDKLTCTRKVMENESSSTYSLKFTFKSDRVSKLKYTSTLSSNNKEALNQLYANMKEEANNYKEKYEGVSVSLSKKENKLSLTVKVANDNINEILSELIGRAKTKKEIKDELESEGFSCK